ncbi:mitochondrial ribosomal subunit S27-domain-containing protein [Xylaria sp. FL1777]|nr:mitochondrial ribosomal subunit S27-domain-containing protein [Xylaria sp. FL1777]
MAAVTRARLLDLMKVQCQIFSTTYNPEGIRMGNKILRQRLRGPSLAKYYPPKGPTINTLEKEFKSLGLEVLDEEEEDRQEHLAGQVACVLLLHVICPILTFWQPETTWKGRTEEEAHCAR